MKVWFRDCLEQLTMSQKISVAIAILHQDNQFLMQLRDEVKYRHPYTCRHTFISHALSVGVEPVKVAELVGHSVKVLYERYAADISGGLVMPDLF